MKHTIDIEGLPEGWEPVAFRKPLIGEKMFQYGKVHRCNCEAEISSLIIKKKQPRRIVLEEVEERNSFIKIDGIPYRIVEDSGDKNDD